MSTFRKYNVFIPQSDSAIKRLFRGLGGPCPDCRIREVASENLLAQLQNASEKIRRLKARFEVREKWEEGFAEK